MNQAFAVPASVLVPVAGKPCLLRVMEAIKSSRYAQGGMICGPAIDVLEQSEETRLLLQDPNFTWLAPARGPASSTLRALEKLKHYPTLLTAGDHALLNGKIVDDFCKQARAAADRSKHDFIIGFVPYGLVQTTWPESKRTILKFTNGFFCGSNLFALLNPDGIRALTFWRQAEADRKHPWRIARRFGPGTLLRYLLRQLTLDEALKRISIAAGCSIGYVQLEHARAAVDVDSIEDQQLAEKILTELS